MVLPGIGKLAAPWLTLLECFWRLVGKIHDIHWLMRMFMDWIWVKMKELARKGAFCHGHGGQRVLGMAEQGIVTRLLCGNPCLFIVRILGRT